MKRLLLIVSFLCSCLLSFSQKSEEILKTLSAPLLKDDVFIGLISLKDDSHVLINTNDDREYTFRRYDKNLNPVREATTTLVYGIAKAKHFHSVIHLKGKFYLSFSQKDLSDYLYSLYVIEFDPYEMVFKGNFKQVFRNEALARGTVNQIPNMHYGYRNIPNTVNCYYKHIQVENQSPDSSKFLVAYSIADSASWRGNKLLKYSELEIVSDTEKVNLVVFDSDFKKLWKREFIFRNKTKVEDYAVTNDGKVYVLAKVDSLKSRYGTNYEVIIFKDSLSDPEVLCPNLVGKSMRDGKFFSPDGKTFKIVGTYSDTHIGFYSVTIYDTLPHYGETSGDLVHVKFKNDVFLRDIIRTKEGKFKVIFEEYSLNKYSTNEEYEARTTSGVVKETFGNLYILSLTSTGNIEWNIELPKLQVDLKNPFSVSTVLPYRSPGASNPLRIYYIDSEKNFGNDWKADHELGRFACLAEVMVNPSGNITKFNIGKIDKLGSLKTKFYFSKDVMYTVNHLNKKNTLYKLKTH